MSLAEMHFFLVMALSLGAYWLAPARVCGQLLLLALAMAMAVTLDPRLLVLGIATVAINYLAELQIESTRARGKQQRWLLLMLLTNLLLVYACARHDFFRTNLDKVCAMIGLKATRVTRDVAIPAALAFYAFQNVSHGVDLLRHRSKAIRSLRETVLTQVLAPQLVSGAIIRSASILPDLRRVLLPSGVNWRYCLLLLLTGFCKKSCLADSLAPLTDSYLAGPERFAAVTQVIGLGLSAAQLLLELSGLADMAVASAGMLGLTPWSPNPEEPLAGDGLLPDMAAFWRQWWQRLSQWLVDYRYIGLTGERGALFVTYSTLLPALLTSALTLAGASHPLAILATAVAAWMVATNRQERARSPAARVAVRAAVSGLVLVLLILVQWPASLQGGQLLKGLLGTGGTATLLTWSSALPLMAMLALLLGLRVLLVFHGPRFQLSRRLPAFAYAFAYGMAWSVAIALRTSDSLSLLPY